MDSLLNLLFSLLLPPLVILYFIAFMFLFTFPLLFSFLVPILVFRKAYATFNSKKILYKWLAISALGPSLLTYIYSNVYHNDILNTSTFMTLFPLMYVGSLFVIWLFLPKINMHIGWKIICWAFESPLSPFTCTYLCYYFLCLHFLHKIDLRKDLNYVDQHITCNFYRNRNLSFL